MNKPLSERIRELREQHDLSVRELAKKAKLSAAFVSDVELGRRHPSDDVLERLAHILDTTVKDLKKHDARAPIQELKRIAAVNPAMGFMLRQIVDQNISAEELQKFFTR